MDLENRVRELEEKLEQALKRIKELESLERENKALKKRIEELEKYIAEKETPPFIKPNSNSNHKKSGQKEGHKGYTRHIPERIDFVKTVAIHRCPNCRKPLSAVQEVRERYVEDIPQVKTKITKYRIERRYCAQCKKIVEAEVKGALPNARLGLKTMLLIAFLKLGLRLPSKKIVELMEINYDLKISNGEVYKTLEQLSRALGAYYEELRRKIKEAAVKHIDETGWRIDGQNSWLWIFINKEAALYSVRKHRSSKMPIRVLGAQAGRVVISDRLPVYTQLAKEMGCAQQICWAHVLRDSKDLAQHYAEARYIHRRLKQIYKRAIALEHRAADEEVKKLFRQIDLIAARSYEHWEVHKFVQSVCKKHRDNLFRFVNNPEIDSTNNLAERGLRHAVIIRKISNGSRSEKGAEVTTKLLSVIQTLKLHGQNPVIGMMNLLQESKL